MRHTTTHPIVLCLFAYVWRNRIGENKLRYVTGWRSCLWDTPCGQRVRVEFILRKAKPFA